MPIASSHPALGWKGRVEVNDGALQSELGGEVPLRVSRAVLAGRCVTTDELDESILLAEIALLDPEEQADLFAALAADPEAIRRLVAHARLTHDLIDDLRVREYRTVVRYDDTELIRPS
jgi:hypothetical protein